MTTTANLLTIDLDSLTAVELRKLGAEAGIKGAAKGKKADLLAALRPMQATQVKLAEQANARAAKEAAKAESTGRNVTAGDDSEEAKKARRSRLGMVIVAKGTEIHKSQTFKEAAEAAGWTVTIEVTARMVEEDDEIFEIECYTATAEQKGSVVIGSWVGRAWDYAGAAAGVGGKARKVRNLKEALRILANQA